ncbi:response regulator [Puniceicoccaceae bacterium K14]|nr:response regulator [Puniceicoccaceae bacterium K14]
MSHTILTVDDAATIRKMVVFTLKGAGHRIVEATDGLDALSTLQSNPVDLIITDVNMPRMDGIELTKKIRSMPAHSRTPVILLTTESDPAKKQQGRAAGATGWIVKPFNQQQLLAVIAKVLPN